MSTPASLPAESCSHPSFRDPFVWDLAGERLHQATCTACRSTLTIHVGLTESEVRAHLALFFLELGAAVTFGPVSPRTCFDCGGERGGDCTCEVAFDPFGMRAPRFPRAADESEVR